MAGPLRHLLTVSVIVAAGWAGSGLVAAWQLDELEFEVASVKVNDSQGPGFSYRTTEGLYRASNMPLRWLIAQAFSKGPAFARPLMPRYHQIFGGDERVLDSRFDVVGKLPARATHQDTPAMLRRLLAERFDLRVRYEKRSLPSYELRERQAGTLGPSLRRSPHDCRVFRKSGASRSDPSNPRDAKGRLLCWPQGSISGSHLTARSAGTIDDLIIAVQAYIDKPVLDRTGLRGNYEWEVTFDRMQGFGIPDNPQGGESVFDAFRRQLGLVLESRVGPVEVLAIDSVRMPTSD